MSYDNHTESSGISLLMQFKLLNKLIDRFIDFPSEDMVQIKLLGSGKPYRNLPSDLMSSVLLTSGAMTALIGRLQDRGLVLREKDSNDARKHYVVLTEKGVQSAQIVMERLNNKIGKVSESLDDLEQLQLRKTLKKIEERLKPFKT